MRALVARLLGRFEQANSRIRWDGRRQFFHFADAYIVGTGHAVLQVYRAVRVAMKAIGDDHKKKPPGEKKPRFSGNLREFSVLLLRAPPLSTASG
jgi:hypothetical protein